MLIEQIIEFKLKGLGASWSYMFSYNWLFSCQNKNKENLRVGYYLVLEYLKKI